jgi:serine/threonine protein kinase
MPESTPASTPAFMPTEIGGYEVLSELTPGESYLAVTPGNRVVALKMLDRDCLLRSGPSPKLHPNIRDRLGRVRELAHGRVANLHGVEHDQGLVYLVWEYVAGQTLEEWASASAVSQRELLVIARELILTLESLHARGIVHGSIHGRNVIIDSAGTLKLTHLSPLMYTDPQHDLASVAELFRVLATKRGDADSPLGLLAQEADEPDGTLRTMGSRAATLIDLKRDEASEALERQTDSRRRRRSRLAAAIVVIAALFLSYGVRQYVSRLTAKPPSPPEAPPAALEP